MQQKKTTQEEYQKCVNAVVDYINLHLGEEIDLKSLARISHFSPFYFHRIMKAFLGEPVGTFIVRTRTEAAARLLRYSDMPIADIAYRIGYSSPSSLSKVFKQFYGISPLEYRNNKNFVIMKPAIIYNPQIQISAESETKRSIFREKDKTKRSKKESAQHSKSRNKSFVMTSVSAL